jgi:predicted alpha-1,2-mannosidase
MKNVLLLFCSTIIVVSSVAQEKNLGKYVNPFVGTDAHGHTFPGATLPFGMVQLSPDTRIDGSWDGCSGYHYSDSIIYGFSHTHLSGTGVSDYGDILLMPMAGEASFENKKYSAKFSHKNEKASPGYYAVRLDNGINVELTASLRAGFHKYHFSGKDAHVILDLLHRDELLEGNIEIVDNKTVAVKRRSRAWATDQHCYAYIVFSKPFSFKHNPEKIKTIFSFDLDKNEELLVKVGISLVSEAGAKKNLEQEIKHWNFEKVKDDAEAAWNKELSKILVKDPDEEKLKTFYTALYHTMIHPNIATDVDGYYRGLDKQIHKAEGFDYYTVFSLWDTFRSAHPLYTLIDRKRTLDFIKTFLAQYQQGGRLPVWELAGNETDCMIGYHSVSVITDAAVKGINDFDMDLAFEAMTKSATWDHLGLPQYMSHGHLTIDDEHESVSKTLEYAYDDWCIAQMARLMGNELDYLLYMKRSQYWKNLLDPQTGFMRPKKNGGWLTPFDPREVNNHFTEGNSWQYSFFVPHDIYGLIEMMGGAQRFEKKLDELFTTDTKTTGRTQVDITGLIGQYAHGNEPSHHMAYLYHYIGKPHKAQQRLHQIMREFYSSKPDGLIGNEDCGQMSAWYVLSALGLYQVTPGITDFIISSPFVNEAAIHLENGKTFTVKAKNLTPSSFYTKSVKLNGKTIYENAVIPYENLLQGGELEFNLTAAYSPGKTVSFPPREIIEDPIITVPVISADSKTFKENLAITITPTFGDHTIYYTTDGTMPGRNAKLYQEPFYITESCTIQALSVSVYGEESFIVSGSFHKMPSEGKIKILSKYNPQYSAGGDEGLIDGVRGDENWRKGDWQGYQGQDFEAIISYDSEKTFSMYCAGFLQDTRSWILMPKNVEFYASNDGVNFQLISAADHSVEDKDYNTQKQEICVITKTPVKAKHIKIKAKNYGTLPEWHQGAGYEAFIFIDEIILN